MALLPIVQYPDPRLATKAEPVTVFDDALKQLAADMAETMYAAPGVGLAATQVGKLIRMVVIDISEEIKECEEGCLSLPGLYEKVKRPSFVTVKAQDLKGKFFEMQCDELMSVCVQHELDHLDGIVFIDHLSQLKKSRAVTKLAKRRKEKAREEKAKRENR